MKTLILISILLLNYSAQTFAGQDKGNGGSGSEAQVIAQQAQLESVSLKLRSFFLKNEQTLQVVFPEFSIQDLAKKIRKSDIRVVDEDKLIDKKGDDRTCLNFPDSALIECKYKEIEKLLEQPATLFVLVLHEYLGLLNVEETSPSNPLIVAGYSVSKRIAPYVTKVSDYDLVLKKECDQIENAKEVSLYIFSDNARYISTTGKAFSLKKEEVFGSNDMIKTREELIVSLFNNSKVKSFLRELPTDSQNLLVATTREDIERNIKNEKLQCN